MAVHVPLSLEAQLEARVLMMSTNNILHPANGQPIIVPSQDIVLGLYHLSLMNENEPGEGMAFSDMGELEHALADRRRHACTPRSRAASKVYDDEGKLDDQDRRDDAGPHDHRRAAAEATRRCPYETANQLMTKKIISKMIDTVYRGCGQKETVIFCDRIMDLGFTHACRAGISFGKDDMVIPDAKTKIVEADPKQVEEYEQQYNDGLITQGEKYNKVVDAWAKCGDKVAEEMMERIEAVQFDKETGRQKPINSVYMMSHSGARGSPAQMKQLAGMRGLMARPDGSIIETPITSNFKEGLNVLEYFNSTHGARKGLADTALKTANSGYLTRRLVDVAQDCIIIAARLRHRYAASPWSRSSMPARSSPRSASASSAAPRLDDIDPSGDGRGDRRQAARCSTEKDVDAIEAAGIQSVSIRSPLTCDLRTGVLRGLLRPRPRPRYAGQHRRSGRRHRGAVDRRAGHPAHHAHVPHRWHGAGGRHARSSKPVPKARSRSATATSPRSPAASSSSWAATWRSPSSTRDGKERSIAPRRPTAPSSWSTMATR